MHIEIENDGSVRIELQKNNNKGDFIMKKYTIYRIYGVKDENSPKRKKELAAVEYGADFSGHPSTR